MALIMNKNRAVVIGSGFRWVGGRHPVASGRISNHCFEKRDRPGGRAYVYKDQGFTFDAGPTIITAPPASKNYSS